MTLPISARVEAAPNFVANLAAAHAFFALQDEQSADLRLSKLKAELREMNTATNCGNWNVFTARVRTPSGNASRRAISATSALYFGASAEFGQHVKAWGCDAHIS